MALDSISQVISGVTKEGEKCEDTHLLALKMEEWAERKHVGSL